MGLADQRVVREATFDMTLDDPKLGAAVANLTAQAEAALIAQNVGDAVLLREAVVHIRYAGTDSGIEVPYDTPDAMRETFAAQYLAQFGFVGDAALIVYMIRVEAIAKSSEFMLSFALPETSAPPLRDVTCFMDGMTRQVPLYDRHELASGFSLNGPAIIVDPVSTTVVEPDWHLEIDRIGNIILTRNIPQNGRAHV